MSNKIALLAGIISPLNTEIQIPSQFLCPITQEIITEPVRIAGSKYPVAYDKKNLEAYFEEHGFCDPKTNMDLGENFEIIPDKALQRKIEDFLESKQQRRPSLSF